MPEKAKGIVTQITEKTSAAGKNYYFATIGGVKFLFFDSKIKDYLDKEVEIEYTEKNDDKGTTFFGNFPGAARSGGGGAPKRGSSPEELKQKAIDMKLRTKTMIFSYAKDLVIANRLGPEVISVTADDICKEMDVYIQYMLKLVSNNIKELEG